MKLLAMLTVMALLNTAYLVDEKDLGDYTLCIYDDGRIISVPTGRQCPLALR